MLDAKDDMLHIIRTFLPKYLTPELQENLFKTALENFPSSSDPNLTYSRIADSNYLYQGDCVCDVPFALFNQGKFDVAYLNGLVMSNTCDIAPDNERTDAPNVQFAAVIALSEYLERLRSKKIDESKIQNFIVNLKNNKISNLFYLPEKKNSDKLILQESFVRFDLNVTLASSIFTSVTYSLDYFPFGDRRISLSNYGFYLFLIKLSIHYCRFREGVFRND
jgi:hypothetical protein